MQEKIARSLIPHERILVASYYGKFFARNLNLYLLRKDPEQWKNTQTTNKTAASAQGTSSTKPTHTPVLPGVTLTDGQDARDTATKPESVLHKAKEKKRKNRPDDEIDQLFDKQLGKKVRKAELTDKIKSKDTPVDGGDNSAADLGLDAVFGAMAPKGDKPRRDKKKTKKG